MAENENTLILETTQGPVTIEMRPISLPVMLRGSRNWFVRGSTMVSYSIALSMASWRRPDARKAPVWAAQAKN